MKRRGNRRYYQVHEVKLIRQIRQLLYEQGFTIVGARNKLQEFLTVASGKRFDNDPLFLQLKSQAKQNGNSGDGTTAQNNLVDDVDVFDPALSWPLFALVRHELMSIRDLLGQ